MKKRAKEELALYTITEDRDYVNFEDIREIFLSKTSEVLYILRNDRIYGVISVGDIFRREINSVKINKRFTCLTGFQDEAARKIFDEKTNIHKIPVIDQEGHILGDYSRWSDKEEVYVRWIFEQANIWKSCILNKYI